jgi:succinate dehydrogenase / fumarate reductase cytochrome b subunit
LAAGALAGDTPSRKEAMNAVLALFRSTIGRKIVMAVTGCMLVGFVIAHMIGNLQVYLGPGPINEYGESLRHILHGAGIWIARGGLLLAVLLHIWSATSLTLQNRAARPRGYRKQQWNESTYASRTMRWSGVTLLVFIVYHLLHFTVGSVHPDFIPGDVYHNFVVGFKVPLVSGFYILAMLLLGMHLYHGVWSMLQTLGLSHPRYNPLRHAFATVVAATVVIGNISMPVAVLAGIIDEAPRAPQAAQALPR